MPAENKATPFSEYGASKTHDSLFDFSLRIGQPTKRRRPLRLWDAR